MHTAPSIYVQLTTQLTKTEPGYIANNPMFTTLLWIGVAILIAVLASYLLIRVIDWRNELDRRYILQQRWVDPTDLKKRLQGKRQGTTKESD